MTAGWDYVAEIYTVFAFVYQILYVLVNVGKIMPFVCIMSLKKPLGISGSEKDSSSRK